MKNLLVLIVLCLFSCSTPTEENIESIENSKELKAYLETELKFISQATDKKMLLELASDSELSESDLPKFYELLKTDKASFIEFTKLQNQRAKNIEAKYQISKLSEKDQQALFVSILLDSNETEVNSLVQRDCKGVYIASLALIASTAYAAHLGCLTLDATIIGGALCHSAAVIGQVAANYIASEDYNDCLENQKS
ncbi:MAG: hypothetical protein ACK4M4_04350 [Flavobacterium sp.]